MAGHLGLRLSQGRVRSIQHQSVPHKVGASNRAVVAHRPGVAHRADTACRACASRQARQGPGSATPLAASYKLCIACPCCPLPVLIMHPSQRPLPNPHSAVHALPRADASLPACCLTQVPASKVLIIHLDQPTQVCAAVCQCARVQAVHMASLLDRPRGPFHKRSCASCAPCCPAAATCCPWGPLGCDGATRP